MIIRKQLEQNGKKGQNNRLKDYLCKIINHVKKEIPVGCIWNLTPTSSTSRPQKEHTSKGAKFFCITKASELNQEIYIQRSCTNPPHKKYENGDFKVLKKPDKVKLDDT